MTKKIISGLKLYITTSWTVAFMRILCMANRNLVLCQLLDLYKEL